MDGHVRLFPRIVQYDGFEIYGGPCISHPSTVRRWVSQFCEKEEHDWFCRISLAYVEDSLTTYGLGTYVPNIRYAAEMICDKHSMIWRYLTDEELGALHEQAKQLYGLIHARWICTPAGLQRMKRRVRRKTYGVCPRVRCSGMPLLPMGSSPEPNRHSAKLFCCRCSDVYVGPPDVRIDGAYFGPSFPAVFLIVFPEFDLRSKYVVGSLTLFGFRMKNDPLKCGPHGRNYYHSENQLEEDKFKSADE
jgi:casein kinase II subunit beta